MSWGPNTARGRRHRVSLQLPSMLRSLGCNRRWWPLSNHQSLQPTMRSAWTRSKTMECHCRCARPSHLVALAGPYTVDSGLWTEAKPWISPVGRWEGFLHRTGKILQNRSLGRCFLRRKQWTAPSCSPWSCSCWLGTGLQWIRLSWLTRAPCAICLHAVGIHQQKPRDLLQNDSESECYLPEWGRETRHWRRKTLPRQKYCAYVVSIAKSIQPCDYTPSKTASIKASFCRRISRMRPSKSIAKSAGPLALVMNEVISFHMLAAGGHGAFHGSSPSSCRRSADATNNLWALFSSPV